MLASDLRELYSNARLFFERAESVRIHVLVQVCQFAREGAMSKRRAYSYEFNREAVAEARHTYNNIAPILHDEHKVSKHRRESLHQSNCHVDYYYQYTSTYSCSAYLSTSP